MIPARSFGRRIDPQQKPQRARKAADAVHAAEKTEIAPSSAIRSPLDDELRAWKQARRRNFTIPWRQLSLMAGLCFGIASFVLPDSMNDMAQWTLYALMAAGFYAGLRKRKVSSAPD